MRRFCVSAFFSVTLHAMKHLRTYFILTIIAFVIASCTDGEQGRKKSTKKQVILLYIAEFMN
ncbi:hypothetical protein SAMN04487901_101102 [Prevotella communis]|uniref:Uncharacterized protein n=1 Tax=Prevotella communis TaxID=2913614 RepID=A0A1G7RUM3_9BACT|nr:hypothetical protein SAMN04487901_101102 [Prevotella communis]